VATTWGNERQSDSAPAVVTSREPSPPEASGARRPHRDIDDGESLRGATKAEVAEAARRRGWSLRGRSRDGNGDVWEHPTKRGEQVIINDGYGWSDDAVHKAPYVKISRNGKKTRYPLSESEDV
jgi:hypothetical protein